MIFKKLFGLLVLLLLVSNFLVIAQETGSGNADPVVPVLDGESTVSGNDTGYSLVPEETLKISDSENRDGATVNTSLNTFSVWDFVRMLLVLGAVLAFIYLIFFLLKKAGKPKIVSDSTINILSSQNLESGRSLHLVEIGPQVFLIGSGEGSVRLISEIQNKETLDTIKLDKSVRSDDNKTFTDLFKGLFKKDNAILHQTKSVQNSFMQKQRNRLKNM